MQGVYYRASARDVAESLALQGWIKNLPSGEVEAMATGELNNLKKFADWCRQGPPGAKVESVQQTDMPETPFSSFQILRGR